MQKIYIYITFPIFSFFYFSLAPAYASSDEQWMWGAHGASGFSSTHSQHPPHDHHEIDHLKYIRTRDEKKKKKLH